MDVSTETNSNGQNPEQNILTNELLESILQDSDAQECMYYYVEISKKIKELRMETSPPDEALLKILVPLAKATMLHMNLDDPNVFRPSITNKDFSPEDLTVFVGFIPNTDNDELRARMADILWSIKYPPKLAYQYVGIAINSYLAAADKLLTPNYWYASKDRYERAFQLSRSVGRQGQEHYNKISEFVVSVIEQNHGNDDGIPCSPFLRLLIEWNPQESIRFITTTQNTAINAEGKGLFDTAKLYWEITAKLHQLNNDNNLAEESFRKAAYCDVEKGKLAASGDLPQFMLAASFIEDGIQALRQHNELREKINELHKLLLEYQSKGVKQTVEIRHEIDVSSEVFKRIELVSNKDFPEAILTLARMCVLPTKSEIRSQVLKLNETTSYKKLFPIQYFNRKGKTEGNFNYGFEGSDEFEDSLLYQMNEQVAWNCTFEANVLAPVINQIRAEHNIRLSDFDFIVKNNGFIPPGHEKIFAAGFFAGFNMDFLSASHLLVPQVENSFRYLLEQRGEVTSSLDSSGIQKEKSLEETLKHPVIVDMFRDDILFVIKSIFSEGGNGGLNLRNLIAHGLLTFDDFNRNPKFIYAWLLILWICCVPILSTLAKESKEELLDSQNEGKQSNNENELGVGQSSHSSPLTTNKDDGLYQDDTQTY